MIKYLLAIILLMHGLIHFMGFAKAFGYVHSAQITKDISKAGGILWFVTALLFIAVVILFLVKNGGWPVVAIIAVMLSQVLIFTDWKEAKFGTIANAIVFFAAILTWGSLRFEGRFMQDTKAHLQQTTAINHNLLTRKDIQFLPPPVQKYLQYAGVLDKSKVKNVRIVFFGEMRDRGKDWFTFRSVQYNFFDDPARLFFMKAKMFGVTVPGYHDYQQATARMRVKLFGLFPVMQASGMEMNKAETVTVFNDMCLMAPATLIDKRIEWVPVDSMCAKAIFTNGTNKITATLYFNAQGQLVNFISDDRYTMSDRKQYRFSTPVKEYTRINERNILKYGEAVWHYPEGEFVYGKFYLNSIEYNVTGYIPEP